MTYSNKFKLIIFFSFLLKLTFILFFHEKGLSDEWLILFKNYLNNKSYSYYIFDGRYIPSSYMPPLYLFFLYFSKIISLDMFNFLYVTYFFQLLLSTFSVYLFFYICRNFFNKNYSLFGVLIFSIFPLLVYSNALVSSATLQLFLYLSFFKLYLDLLNENKNIFKLVCLIFVSSACLLLRGEFLIILLFSIIYLVVINKKMISFAIILIVCSFLITSPYIIRNFMNTGKIHIVNVTGYALWKGNNHLAKVEGFHNSLHPNQNKSWPKVDEFKNLYKKLNNVPKNNKYEINRDEVFKKEAINNIFSDKKKYFKLYLKKLISYFFIDINSTLKNYYHPAHIYPLIIFSFMSLPGFLIGIKKFRNSKIVYIFLITGLLTFLISSFFILPRYKISIISFQILSSLFFIEYLIKIFKKEKKI